MSQRLPETQENTTFQFYDAIIFSAVLEICVLRANIKCFHLIFCLKLRLSNHVQIRFPATLVIRVLKPPTKSKNHCNHSDVRLYITTNLDVLSIYQAKHVNALLSKTCPTMHYVSICIQVFVCWFPLCLILR